MLTDEHVRTFARLFAGRTDCYGAEWGECIHRPVLPRLWERHLHGQTPLGVYPHLPGDQCWWGAIDIDYVDDPAPAVAVQEVWRWYGVPSFVERSRSKGWHVWVFLERPLGCGLVRSADKAVAKMAGLDPRVEVYPKAKTLGPSSADPRFQAVGNYLRLPYPGNRWLDGHRAVWGHLGPTSVSGLSTGDGWWWTPEAFIEEAWKHRVSEASLRPLERLQEKVWGVGAKAATEAVRTITEAVLGRLNNRVSQDIVNVAFRGEQVPEGRRDLTFYTMARFLAGSGVEETMALDIVEKVWSEQTDQAGHAFPLKDAQAKIRRAYQAKGAT